MSATVASVEERPSMPQSQGTAFDLIKFWLTECQQFLSWQRREVIERAPTAQTLAEHRASLKWMLRFTRLIHAQVADPDFRLPGFAPEVDGNLSQLEESWGLIHDPMPDDEADAILKTSFPDEARVGSLA